MVIALFVNDATFTIEVVFLHPRQLVTRIRSGDERSIDKAMGRSYRRRRRSRELDQAQPSSFMCIRICTNLDVIARLVIITPE
ncbi:hypothetical protein SAY87_019063 [Trapa incisa]|uniref:Uncharacterized protein n=1 Tax=Trapa incisa TaxID=236973 RepID=A0AAN7K458_9MYRT|nr:hypothetical protein SAY87_019063 [Trapa incisa]